MPMSRTASSRVAQRSIAAALFGLSVTALLAIGALALALGGDWPADATSTDRGAPVVVVVDRVGRPLGELVPPEPTGAASEREVPEALRATLTASGYFERSDGTEAMRRLSWVLTGAREGPARGPARAHVDATGPLRAADTGGLGGSAERLRRTLAVAKTEAAMDDELVVSYLNRASFGRGARGVSAAAQTYFGLPVTQLTDQQARYLAQRLMAATDSDGSVAISASNHEGWTVTATTGDAALDATVISTLRWLTGWLVTRYGEVALASARLEVALSLDLHAQQIAQRLATDPTAKSELGERAGVVVVDDTAGVRVLLGEVSSAICDAHRAPNDASCLRLVLSVTDTERLPPAVVERWPAATTRAGTAVGDWLSVERQTQSDGLPPAFAQRLLNELVRQLHPDRAFAS